MDQSRFTPTLVSGTKGRCHLSDDHSRNPGPSLCRITRRKRNSPTKQSGYSGNTWCLPIDDGYANSTKYLLLSGDIYHSIGHRYVGRSNQDAHIWYGRMYKLLRNRLSSGCGDGTFPVRVNFRRTEPNS